MTTLVLGTAGNDTLTAPSGDGTDYKYDAKGGNDVVIGSTGDDLLIGGAGSDYLFGGLGKDTFEFSKFANAGDTDYIVDFKLELGDVLKVFNGATITGATAEFSSMTEFNGRTLANDPKVYDLTLDISVVDGAKNFTYTVTLMDVLKNQTYSAAEFNNYLHSLGYSGDIVFA
jgi:Ca2+-binding RTX toxin-like protein